MNHEVGETGDREMSMKNLETPTGRKERVPNLPRQALPGESDVPEAGLEMQTW